ncbi:MAG: mannitol-1-phosphate 5-dehydrogenase [Bacteroidales bacterium]|nr:mannitol-1-phosphate 5-dehydrogenase [Bacteroidales bacterium]
MKKAIQFGAGNIGRGFIGAVLAGAGYEVVFADVVEDLLTNINSRKEYTVHVTDSESYDIDIKGIRAVNSNSAEAVQEVVDAEVITTAVGLRILKFVAPAIAKGLVARKAAGNEAPLNVIACENGLRATSQLKELVFAQLDAETAAWAESHVGFPDAAVDRIVPPVRCEIPLDVAVEEYFEWDVERASFVGEIPQIPGMTPVDNLLAYVERKLFTLNTGHATAAYLGKLKGISTIGESIADSVIAPIVKAVMQQSGEGLVKKFGFDHDAHFAYIEKILKRFSNPFLRDECNRVGREPLRKLAPNDRLILPMMTAKGFGLPYDKILLAIGGALHFENPEDPQSVEMLASIAAEGLEATIVKYTGIEAGDPLIAEIVDAYHKVETI